MLYKGFLFGLTLQLAVGPVFFMVFNRALQQGLATALIMTLGVTLADAIYIAISFTGVSQLLTIPFINQAASWLAAIVLAAFGLSYFRTPTAAPGITLGNNTSAYQSFILGLKITLANPLTIMFWSCTLSAVITSSNLLHDDILKYTIGCILSTLAFLSLTSILAQPLSHVLKPPVLALLNYLVGFLLIGFAGIIILGI
ncbi:MAG: LysE family translocator [Methylocystaceae bacterium]